MSGGYVEWVKSSDESVKEIKLLKLKAEKSDIQSRMNRIDDAFESGSHSKEKYDERTAIQKDRLKKIEEGIAQLSKKDDDLEE